MSSANRFHWTKLQHGYCSTERQMGRRDDGKADGTPRARCSGQRIGRRADRKLDKNQLPGLPIPERGAGNDGRSSRDRHEHVPAATLVKAYLSVSRAGQERRRLLLAEISERMEWKSFMETGCITILTRQNVFRTKNRSSVLRAKNREPNACKPARI